MQYCHDYAKNKQLHDFLFHLFIIYYITKFTHLSITNNFVRYVQKFKWGLITSHAILEFCKFSTFCVKYFSILNYFLLVKRERGRQLIKIFHAKIHEK